jgi:hypothetical protein
VQAVLTCPVPALVHTVRMFLELAGYYRCFIHNFGAIAPPPLPMLLHKEKFRWTAEAEDTLHTLQQALMTTHAFRLPSFYEEFIVE